jgi:hypothetical protein
MNEYNIRGTPVEGHWYKGPIIMQSGRVPEHTLTKLFENEDSFHATHRPHVKEPQLGDLMER